MVEGWPHPVMDLNSATWMVRQLEQPVSMVHLDEHHGVFAGGWDGRLTHWDEAGEHVWTAQTNDRISALALSEDVAVVASGLHIVALDRATGEERWSMALEGSADAVVWWQGDVVAVSSVYDIEHNDSLNQRFGASPQTVSSNGWNEWTSVRGP
jgi:outer membrane protein assembly factor BamB